MGETIRLKAIRTLSLGLFLSTTALASPALAQSSSEPPTPSTTTAHSEDGQSDDIVVTALRRDTTLQDTPISISAVTGETLANAGVQNVADLAARVPSLTFVDGGPSQRRVVIRGIVSAGEPLVGTYYDEAAVTGSPGATNDAGGSTPELRLFDVQRVEVLRGPQGTLYGSGSMGGTLRVIFNKPTMKVETAVDASLSSTKDGGLNYEGNAMVNVPVVQDKIALRAVGFFRKANGYIDNTALNIKNINDAESYGGRILLRLTPVDDLTIDAAAYLNWTTTDTPAWTLGAGRYKSDALTRLPLRDRLQLYSLTSSYDLGSVTLTGVGTYLRRDFDNSTFDASRFVRSNRTAGRCAALTNAGRACDAGQLASFYGFLDGQSTSLLHPMQDMDSYTAELRLSSDGSGPVNWTVGGFYANRITDVANPQVNADPVTGNIIYPLQKGTERLINDKLRQLAGFAEISWDLTSRLNLTAGGRYFTYKRNIVGTTTVPSVLFGARLTPPTEVMSSESGVVLKFNGSYKITPDVLLYAEAAQGFRPGGANQVLGVATTLPPYDSDKLWNYEIGLKNELFDRRMTLNVDVFQIDWRDMQITGRTPDGAFSFITNAGSSKVRGVEVETGIRPVRGFTISGNASYIDAVLTQNQSNANVSAPGLDGDRIPYVPKFTIGGAAEYRQSVSDNLDGVLRFDATHLSGSFSDFRPTGTFTRQIRGYELVNARIGIENDRFGAFVFATNLFNDVAITRASSSALVVGRTLVNSAMPRTIGLNIRGKF